MSMFKNEKFWLVVAGAVGSAVAKKVLKAKKTCAFNVNITMRERRRSAICLKRKHCASRLRKK